MTDNIRHFSKRLRREADERTTTRYIVVEESSCDGFRLSIYEFKPTKFRRSSTPDYELKPVNLDWFSTLDEGISAAEIALRSSLNAGFREVVADPSGQG
jgi:hypothetical protein